MITDNFYTKGIFLTIIVFLLFLDPIFSQNWMSKGRFVTSDWAAGDNIGISIAIDGEYMITGAWWEDNDPFVNSAGAAYIFKKDNLDNWQELVKLTSPNPEALGYFGYSVAIDGEFAVVGTYNEDEDDGTTVYGNAGAVYIYHRDPNDVWTMVQRLIANDFGQADYFGYSVAISGDYILVGAYNDDEDAGGNNPLDAAGSAYVFERQSNGDWTQASKLLASDRAAGDNFGKFVDIRGDRAVISAVKKDDDPNFLFDVGAAYIFERNSSTGNWSEVQKLLASDHGNFDSFGSDVAIDGDKLWVGAASEADLPGGGSESNTGAAYFFERNSNGVWEEVQKVYSSDHSQGDAFGGALDLHGNILVIGALNEDEDENGGNMVSGAGSAYIFERQANGVWQEVQKVIGENRQFDDLFGASVSIRDDQIAVGAWRADQPDGQDQIFDVGAAYIFKRNMPLALDEKFLNEDIRIAPNPSQGLFRLQKTDGEALDLQLSVFDLYGKKVFEKAIVLMNSWDLRLENLPAGMYIVSLKNEQSAHKILKWMKL